MSVAASASLPPRRRARLMLCGDSLTEIGSNLALDGFVALLQQAHVRSVDVLNRGLSGYSTRWFRDHALEAISEELQQSLQPSLITVWFGANDASLVDGPSKHQHVPLDEYKENLVAIIHEFQRLAPQTKVLVITPPVVDDDWRRRIQVEENGASPDAPIDRTNEQAGAYAKACAEVVATLKGVALLDMHTLMMNRYPNAVDRTALLCDGLHFSKKGNHVVFEELQQVIRSLIPDEAIDTPRLPGYHMLG